MTKVRIFRPAKTAMQSGRAKTKKWRLEFEREAPMTPDALMGWNTMPSTIPQIHLWFASAEDAIAYASSKGLDYEVIAPEAAKIPPKSYAENFSYNRRNAFDKKAQSE